MAATPCRQCAAQVSAEARTCPHCGCPGPAAETAVATAEAAPEQKWQFRMLPAEALGERRVKLPSIGGKAPYRAAGVLWALAFVGHGALDKAYGVGVVFGCLLMGLLALWVLKAMPFSKWRGLLFLAVSISLLWHAPWHADPRQARWKAMMAEGKMPADYEGTARSPGR